MVIVACKQALLGVAHSHHIALAIRIQADVISIREYDLDFHLWGIGV